MNEIRDRGQNEPVEIMRQDLEGAKRTSVPFAVMIAAIASMHCPQPPTLGAKSSQRDSSIANTRGE